MKQLVNAIRQAIAWMQMRSLEQSLQGKLDTLPSVTDESTRTAMRFTIDQLRADLAQARAHYTSFLPAGNRIVWRTA